MTRAEKRQDARRYWSLYCNENGFKKGKKGITLSMMVEIMEATRREKIKSMMAGK